MQTRKLRIGIVVGEVSGDTLGAELIRQFKAQGIDADFEGIGGPQMIAEGFHSLYAMDTLSVMGIVEVLKDIKTLFAVRDGLIERWQQQAVDVFIGIDAPDFNLRVSQKIKQKQLPIKTVQYVSPSVWAWRQKRVVGIQKNIDLVMCLFPFEKAFYQSHHVPAIFVGHPLAKKLPLVDDVVAARQDLGLSQDQQYIALLPGSRGSEVQRLAPLVFGAADILQKQGYAGEFLVPAINDKRKAQIQQMLTEFSTTLQQKVHILDNTHSDAKIGRQVMAASDVVALASGTATLEAMLLHRPMVTFYKLNALTYWLVKKMIKIPYVSLPNIIAGKKVIAELVQQQATPENLAKEIKHLMEAEQAPIQRMQHLTMHKRLISGETEDPIHAILALTQP
ncbi:lipid-A-disaccharide synthase [Acinetobacter rathckeae]|uniref:lipid-A-disaccharide synthase n=1 Tax=Acinetobacter rathckeae TaxID=2605272 RepID=UPI0018A2BFFC|nr:lipid-A-disaccharide synthase [Acinetobacter rathckeae]MBF7686983.1 lipid-A-disaccharide synthase [Acinetobacter rathckeae]MBF7694613.1 lipid-A-disaccharide synthase [Acinetobacter rathckeae]